MQESGEEEDEDDDEDDDDYVPDCEGWETKSMDSVRYTLLSSSTQSFACRCVQAHTNICSSVVAYTPHTLSLSLSLS
jgi:hypothetical protein